MQWNGLTTTVADEPD